MEGIIGFLFVFTVVCFCVARMFNDGTYAVQGKVPPRIRLRMAELAKTGKTRYGFWDYMRDLWSDALQDMTRRRHERRADPNRGRGPLRQFAHLWWKKFWGDRWDHYLANAQKRAKKKAERRERRDAGTTTTPDGEQPTGWRRRLHDWGDWWKHLFAIVLHRGRNTDEAGEEPPASPGATPAPTPAGGGSPAPAPTPRPAPQPLPVIPFPEEGSRPMNDAPEITGLPSATEYAGGMAQAYQGQVAQTEQFVAALQGGGVSGEAVAAAAQAMEAQAAASAAWANAESVLTGHGQVGEAYAANPGAGTREFNTSE